MPHRNWLQHLAIGIGIIISVLLALVVGELVKRRPLRTAGNTEIKYQNRNQDKNPANIAGETGLTVHNHPSSGEFQPDCSQKNDADLCAQIRMANAAEDQLWFTRWGFGLLAGTLIAAFWAAWESHKAAKSADDILKAERAWTTPFSTETAIHSSVNDGEVIHPEGIGIFAVWINSGRSPALDVNAYCEIAIAPMGASPPVFTRKSGESSTIVGQSTQVNTTQLHVVGDVLRSLIARRTCVFFYTACTYKAIFDKKEVRLSELCVLMDFGGYSTDPDGK
jgi:hypothetical protein